MRDFSTLLEKTLITERGPAPSRAVGVKPRLRPEDEAGVLWECFRRGSDEEHALIELADQCAA